MEPTRPTAAEHSPSHAPYVALVTEPDVISVLAAQPGELEALVRALPKDRETYRYAPGKWSVRQVLGHITDAERVFGHRAFCLSRGEQAPLPVFDENTYVEMADYDGHTAAELTRAFTLARLANLTALAHLDDEGWRRTGTASGRPASVRAMAYVMAGHARHHLNGLRKSYGLVA